MFFVANSQKRQLLQNVKVQNPVKPELKFAIGFFDMGTCFAATIHDVTEHGSLGIGKPVSGAEVTHLVTNCMQHEVKRLQDGDESFQQVGWVDKRVLFENTKLVAWITKPVKRSMWFKMLNERFRLTPIWPRLLFIASKTNNNLYVFAVAKATVDSNTKVYHAPLANINSQGVVCQGSATRPTYKGVTDREFLNGCESVIYDSNFTHTNHDYTFNNKRKKVSDSKHLAYWKSFSNTSMKLKAKDMVFTEKRLTEVLGTVQ